MHTAGLRATFMGLFAAVAATLVLTAPAGAATKPYSLVICALGTSETCAPSPTLSANQPAGVPAGATGVSMTAAFLNENKVGTGIKLGSANLTPPAGFTVTSASVSGVPPFVCPSSCSATVVGNVVQLRSMAVPPGSAVTVAMTVNTPAPLTACTVGSPCVWGVLAKQSNEFHGAGNDLTTDTATSTLNTVLAQLQFAPRSEPHNTRLGQAITDSDYNPSGGPVNVDVVDANQALVSSYHGLVSLALNTPNNPLTNPFPATLGGTTATNASGGAATFANLTVSEPGNGFTLTASTSDLPPSTTSTPFNVQQAAALCSENKSCSTEATSTNSGVTDGGIDVTVSSTVSSASGGTSELVESIDFGNWPSATRITECGHASAHFAYQAVSTTSLITVITATITTTDLELTRSNLSASIKAQDICLAEAEGFMAKDESTNPVSLVPAQSVTLPDGTKGFAGLEPDCGKKSNQVLLGAGPCVTGRSGTLNSSGTGGTLTISDSSPNDRWVN